MTRDELLRDLLTERFGQPPDPPQPSKGDDRDDDNDH